MSMRIPDAGPLGETFFEAKVLAIVAASLLNNPGGGCVESVFTSATQRAAFFGISFFFLLGRLTIRLLVTRQSFRPPSRVTDLETDRRRQQSKVTATRHSTISQKSWPIAVYFKLKPEMDAAA